MADLGTTFCGFPVKNPVGVTSCDFGGEARLARRVADQGVGWIVGKTVHRINGPHRWPRPYFFSLRRFGPDLRDAWTCGQMFHHMPYERWLADELPATLEVCREHDMLFVGSCSGTGPDPKTWIPLLRDMAAAGVQMIELDTGGPHATFGAVNAQKEVGAPLALDPDTAYTLTRACVDAVDVPLVFKMTPQCVSMAGVAAAVERAGVSAISANNAFYGAWIDHETGSFYGVPAAMGGLMGRPWQLMSLAKVLEITSTVRVPVIGGGGVFTHDDVARYLLAGCTLVGMCSALYSRGVGVLGRTLADLAAWMDARGHSSVESLQGRALPGLMYLRDWPREDPMAELTPVLPRFDAGRCTRCGRCVELCPYGALELPQTEPRVAAGAAGGQRRVVGPPPQVSREMCFGCGWCMGQCRHDAIRMVHAETGALVWDGRGVIADWVPKGPAEPGAATEPSGSRKG
jgi:dihydropyrimidine dehydrogenase (NAD+) subunit PreA